MTTFNENQPFGYLLYGEFMFDLSLNTPEEQSHAMPVWSKEQITSLIEERNQLIHDRYEVSKDAVKFATQTIELKNSINDIRAEMHERNNKAQVIISKMSIEHQAEKDSLQNKIAMLESEIEHLNCCAAG